MSLGITIKMSTKKESRLKRSSNGMKILNDAQIPASQLPATSSVPLAPTKKITIVGANNVYKLNSAAKQKQMDHYVLHTAKGEENAGIDSESIDFIFTDNNESQTNCGLNGPSGEITEEISLSCDEDGDGDEHTEEIVEHVCGKCYKSFRRLSGLKKHLDFCRFDSGYHLRKAEMIKNLEKIEKDAVVMENKDICFCCGESYDTFHLGHINCPDCPKSFKTQMSYERHIFITHSESNEYPCTICNAKLRSENLLKLHEEQHQNRGKPFACKICGKDFTRSYHLKRHQKYSSCSANENDSMNCKVCSKVFYRLDNLRAHLKQHLGTHVSKKPEYMCPICKNCFYSLSTLNIHTRTHTGERPFDCDLCDKKFPSLVALKKHRRYHTGEKPYTCSVCNQSFAVKEVLNRHMKRHTGERPHVCSECGKSFIQATQLRSHMRTHVKPFECDDCKECFKTVKQLERHAKCHNNTRKRNAKVFKCTVCKAPFQKEEQLARHIQMDIHNAPEETPKTKPRTDCAICEKNFDTVKSLQFHILKVHEVDPEDFINDKPKPKEVDMPPAKIMKLEKNITGKIEVIPPAKEKNGTSTDGEVVVREFILDDAYTVIPLDIGGIGQVNTTSIVAGVKKKKERKSLAESLAAAIADDDDEQMTEVSDAKEETSEEDILLKENVGKLLDMLVDSATLKQFGWPKTSEEKVLCKVIENCGHDLTEDSDNVKNCDYATRMREYVKLLFTVVIHNDSIKELLNNYPIDEVIEYVLGNDDDGDDDDEDDDNDGDNAETNDNGNEAVNEKGSEYNQGDGDAAEESEAAGDSDATGGDDVEGDIVEGDIAEDDDDNNDGGDCGADGEVDADNDDNGDDGDDNEILEDDDVDNNIKKDVNNASNKAKVKTEMKIEEDS